MNDEDAVEKARRGRVRSMGAADRLDRACSSVERVNQAVDYVLIGGAHIRLIMADRVERMRMRREQGRDLWTGEKRNT